MRKVPYLQKRQASGKSAAYQRYDYGIPLLRLLITVAVITSYQTGMPQEHSFYASRNYLLRHKHHVTSAQTTLRIGTQSQEGRGKRLKRLLQTGIQDAANGDSGRNKAGERIKQVRWQRPGTLLAAPAANNGCERGN